MTDDSQDVSKSAELDAEFARIFGEDFVAKAKAAPRFPPQPHQRAVDIERQKLHEENAKLARKVDVQDDMITRLIKRELVWQGIAILLFLFGCAIIAWR